MASKLVGTCIIAAQTNEFNVDNFAIYGLFFVLSFVTTTSLIYEQMEALLNDAKDLMERMIKAVPKEDLLDFADNLDGDFTVMLETLLSSASYDHQSSSTSESFLLSSDSYDQQSSSNESFSEERSRDWDILRSGGISNESNSNETSFGSNSSSEWSMDDTI